MREPINQSLRWSLFCEELLINPVCRNALFLQNRSGKDFQPRTAAQRAGARGVSEIANWLTLPTLHMDCGCARYEWVGVVID